MDLSTMAKKLDRGVYQTIDDVEADFKLMIDNCLTYNNKDTVFYKWVYSVTVVLELDNGAVVQHPMGTAQWEI